MAKNIVVKLPGRTALRASLKASGCAPCQALQLDAQARMASMIAADSAEMLAADRAGEVPWSGTLCIEGEQTGDGRLMEADSLTWAELPLPLRWVEFDEGEHKGAVVVGLIETVARVGNKINGTGFIDGSTEHGAKVLHLMKSRQLRGVSVDLDDMAVEIRVKAEILQEQEEFFEAMMDPDAEMPEPKAAQADEDGYVKVMEAATDDELMVVNDARIRGATLCDIPAFADATLTLDGDPVVPDEDADDEPEADSEDDAEDEGDEVPDEDTAATRVGLVAAASPVTPPAAWFRDPALSEPTPLTVAADGRVYGHIALWDTCHTGFAGQCVTPPRSKANYAWFRTGLLVADDGSEIPVGQLTINTGHAGARLNAAETVSHYDHTGTAGADVSAGEDRWGIWVAGAARSTLSPEQLRVMRAAPMSGDWRAVGGNLELMAVLGVNMPGFPVPRTKALVASGVTQSLQLPIRIAGIEPTRYERALTAAGQARRNDVVRRARRIVEK